MTLPIRRRFTIAALAPLAFFALTFISPSLPAAEASATPSPKAPTRPAATSNRQIRAAAEVIAIDPAARTLRLRREDGNAITVTAGKRVTGLERIEVGDLVIAEYGLARALSMRKIPPGDDAGAAPTPAGLGGTPQRRRIVADIIAIDDRTGQATLKGAGGDIVDVVFRNRQVLARVRIGDRVRAEYADAVAASVKPAGRTIPDRRQSAP
jgi:hypothetical protein